MKPAGLLLPLLFVVAACGRPPSMPESLRNDPPVTVDSDGVSVPTVSRPEVEEAEETEEVEEASGAEPDGSTGPESPTGPTASEDPEPGFVVINEIYYDAVGSDTDGLLFVELYGTPGLGLGGCKISFINGDNGEETESITLPEDAVVGTDGFYLIADSRDGQPAVTQVTGADLVDNFDPQNGPDAVLLLDAAGAAGADGNLLDRVGYGEAVPLFEGQPAPDVASGHSLERASPGLDTDDNAADFVDRVSPTPGQ